MESLLLSVVIPTYNREGLLASTLSSLNRQTLGREQFEVHVVDDGSTDGTRELVQSWRGLMLRYARQEDHGFRAAAARNVGIRAARAPVCVFLDSGMIAAPDFLERHLRAHRGQTGAAAVIGWISGLDQHGHDHHQGNDRVMDALIDQSDVAGSALRLDRAGLGDIREVLFYSRYGDTLDAWPAPWVVFWMGNVSVSTRALMAVGLLDETFVTWGGEDTDLGIRLHRAGVRMILDRSAVAIHLPHPKALAGLSADRRNALRRGTLRRIHLKYRSDETRLLRRVSLEDLNEALGGLGSSTSQWPGIATTQNVQVHG
jgi:glycosyltransferase involved in cell wall biosynthesis